MAEILGETAVATYKLSQTTVRVATEGPQVLVEEADEHQTAAAFMAESKGEQAENELPLDAVHASHERPVTHDRGCWGGERAAEKEVIKSNNNIYTTRSIGEQQHIVFGAPSNGTRKLLQKEHDETERTFWQEAKPVSGILQYTSRALTRVVCLYHLLDVQGP